MQSSKHSGHSTLDDWLAIATRGLCDDARERIREEIASHYEDALSEARGDGLAEDAVVARAVRSLGNPRRARRRLRREHLTRREAKKVKKFVDATKVYLRTRNVEQIDAFPRTLFALGLAIWTAILWSASSVIRAHEGHDSSIAVLAVFVLGGLVLMLGQLFVLFALGKRVSRKLHPDGKIPLWRAVQLEGTKGLFLTVCFVSQLGNHLTSPYTFMNKVADDSQGWVWLGYLAYAVLLVFVLLESMFQLRLSQKLRRLGYTKPPSAMA